MTKLFIVSYDKKVMTRRYRKKVYLEPRKVNVLEAQGLVLSFEGQVKRRLAKLGFQTVYGLPGGVPI